MSSASAQIVPKSIYVEVDDSRQVQVAKSGKCVWRLSPHLANICSLLRFAKLQMHEIFISY